MSAKGIAQNILIAIIISATIITVSLVLVIGGNFKLNSTINNPDSMSGEATKTQRIACPYDCCTGLTEYFDKSCDEYSDCKNSRCELRDSDNDGLSDKDEILKYYTNPKVADTDGDGLIDYQEVMIYYTDPLKTNTDCDRRNDGEEVKLGFNPLVPNSANIIISKMNEKGEYNVLNIIKDGAIIGGLGALGTACSGLTLGACAVVAVPSVAGAIYSVKDDVLYTTSFDALVNNQGTDYTQYVKYKVVFSTSDGQLTSYPIELEKLDTGKSLIKSYKYDLTAKDIPVSLWRYVTGKESITTSVENVEFEKFFGC